MDILCVTYVILIVAAIGHYFYVRTFEKIIGLRCNIVSAGGQNINNEFEGMEKYCDRFQFLVIKHKVIYTAFSIIKSYIPPSHIRQTHLTRAWAENGQQTNILIDMNDILFKLRARCPFYNHIVTFIVVVPLLLLLLLLLLHLLGSE